MNMYDPYSSVDRKNDRFGLGSSKYLPPINESPLKIGVTKKKRKNSQKKGSSSSGKKGSTRRKKKRKNANSSRYDPNPVSPSSNHFHVNFGGMRNDDSPNPMSFSDPLHYYQRQQKGRFGNSITPPPFSRITEEEKMMKKNRKNNRLYHSHPNIKRRKKRSKSHKVNSKVKRNSRKKGTKKNGHYRNKNSKRTRHKNQSTGHSREKEEKQVLKRKISQFFGEDDEDGEGCIGEIQVENNDVNKILQGTHFDTIHVKKGTHFDTINMKSNHEKLKLRRDSKRNKKKKKRGEDERFQKIYKRNEMYKNIVAFDSYYIYDRKIHRMVIQECDRELNILNKKVDLDRDDELEDVFSKHDEDYMTEFELFGKRKFRY